MCVISIHSKKAFLRLLFMGNFTETPFNIQDEKMILCTRDKEKFIGATTVTVFINIRIEGKYPYTIRRRKGEVNKPLWMKIELRLTQLLSLHFWKT